MISVTKTFLPPINEYTNYLNTIWANTQLTNNDPLLCKLEEKLAAVLGVKHVELITNGTLALQIAIKTLDLKGEIITTPFTYVATANAIAWSDCTPVFVHIDPNTLNIDPQKIEAAITDKTSAIMPTHVFGNACPIDEITAIAAKYGLKVIYDGAHVFGCKIKGKSLLIFGDISMISFHATKVFQTIEGGALITENDEIADRILKIKSFGHIKNEYYCLGLNGKMSEFQAAMGLSNLPYVDLLLDRRKKLHYVYKAHLMNSGVRFQQILPELDYNYVYFPIILPSETVLLNVLNELNNKGIYPRRYFYPSLNNLPYFPDGNCPNSDTIASRFLCLPLFHELRENEIAKIYDIINHALDQRVKNRSKSYHIKVPKKVPS